MTSRRPAFPNMPYAAELTQPAIAKALVAAGKDLDHLAGGTLALFDIVAGSDRSLDYPLPWADTPEQSHLVDQGDLRRAIERSGFDVDR